VAGGEEPVPDLQEHRLEDLRQQRAARLVRSQDHLFTDSYHCVFWPEGFCVHLQLPKLVMVGKQNKKEFETGTTCKLRGAANNPWDLPLCI
jgi:hypothetical protein